VSKNGRLRQGARVTRGATAAGACCCLRSWFEVTGDSADLEVWILEARQQVVLNGIPFGREPVDQLELGNQEHCQMARAAYRYKLHAF
jgi:hypothetical protein